MQQSFDPSLATYHTPMAGSKAEDIFVFSATETLVKESESESKEADSSIVEDETLGEQKESENDVDEKQPPDDSVEPSEDSAIGSSQDRSLLNVRSKSRASISWEVRSMRLKIEREKNVDLSNFDPESVLTDEQRRRDSLDDHLYKITCFPDLVPVESIYTCEDVPVLETVALLYEKHDCILDDKLVTSYEAHLQPIRKDVTSFYEFNSLVKCEVPRSLEIFKPALHLVPSTLASYQPLKRNVESTYSKFEISVLTDIDKVFKKSELSQKLIPTEFVQNPCTNEQNYETLYENKECEFLHVPKEYKSNHIQVNVSPSIYQRFVEFDSFVKRVDEFRHPHIKRKSIPSSFRHNVPKLRQIPSTYKRKIPIMQTGRVTSFDHYASQLVELESEFVCKREPEVKKSDEITFKHGQPLFQDGENFIPELLHNAIVRQEIPVEFLDNKLEIFPVETEYVFNEPMLFEAEEE